ncbi:MAG: LysR family transcriptional regulator [Myxococcota bacterium]
MNWDDLRVLLAIVRAPTLTEAAKSLGVTQTTVTRRLAALEEQLGLRLVSRTSHGVVVTEQGREVAAAAADMEARVCGLERALLGRDDAMQGRLRVTTIDMVAHYDAALFASFRARYPDVELEVTAGVDSHDLARDEADVAIRWTNNPTEALVGRRIGPASYALYGSQELVARIGVDALLDTFPWVAWMRSFDTVVTASWMRERIPQDRVVARFNCALPLHAAIRAGVGIGFMPCQYAGDDLVCLRPTEPGLDYDVWLLVHPEARDAARVRAFLDHVVAYYGLSGSPPACC